MILGRWAFHVDEPIWGLEGANDDGVSRAVGVGGYTVDKLELLLWLDLVPRLDWDSLFVDSGLSGLEAWEDAEERREWKAR